MYLLMVFIYPYRVNLTIPNPNPDRYTNDVTPRVTSGGAIEMDSVSNSSRSSRRSHQRRLCVLYFLFDMIDTI